MLANAQAVVATARCKWGDVEAFQQHQGAAQQQDEARQCRQSCIAKRQCVHSDMQWLCDNTDYSQQDRCVSCHPGLVPAPFAADLLLLPPVLALLPVYM